MSQILNLTARGSQVVNLVTPGDTQQAICTPVVYLEATVTGDLTGHSFEWVQISGTPSVTLYTVSPTQAYYIPGFPPGSDKVFRFYVDRNTPFEQVGEVIIRTTPTSVTDYAEPGASYGISSDPDYAYVPNTRLAAGSVFDYMIPGHSVGEYLAGNVLLEWSLPDLFYQVSDPSRLSYQNRLISTSLDKWNGTSWAPMRVANITDIRSAIVELGDRLRIGATYSSRGGNTTLYSPWFDYTASVIAGNTVMNYLEPGASPGLGSVSRLIFKILPIDGNDTIDYIEPGMSPSVFSVTRFVYEIVSIPASADLNYIEPGASQGKFTVTRNSGGSIGG